jgi:hypothetical protein
MDINKMTVLEGIHQDERVFTINVKELYMRDLTFKKPKIAIYNDDQR